MPTTRAGATAAQTQAQLDDENVLNHVLQTIMGFPMDSKAGQALNAAGMIVCEGFADVGWGDVRPANLYGWNG